MKFMPYIWGNIVRNKPRFAMTFLSIMIVFFLLGTLSTLRDAFGFGFAAAADDRLITYSAGQLVPISHFELIKQVPGVDPDRVTYVFWSGGFVGERENWIGGWAAHTVGFLGLHRDTLDIPQEQIERWRVDPVGVIVGSEAAELFGWEIGDTVQIQGGVPQAETQQRTWTYNVSGIFTPRTESMIDGRQFIGHFEYHARTRARGVNRAAWMHIGLLPGANPAEVSRLIDQEFENNVDSTQTMTEQIFGQQLVRRFGNVGLMITWVLIGSFVTLMLVVGTTLSLSIDERRNEFHLMRAVGYHSRLLSGFILGESIAIFLLGGIVGVALSYAVVPILQSVVQSAELDLYTIPLYFSTMVFVGVLVGVIPAIRAARDSRLTDMGAL